MDESALDFDSLSGLIAVTLARMDPHELHEIYYLLETGRLQSVILDSLGLGESDCSPAELGLLTVMLQRALRRIMESSF